MKKPLLAVFLVWLVGPIGLMYVGKRKFWPALAEVIGILILGAITSDIVLVVAQIIYMVIAYNEAKRINERLAKEQEEVFSQSAPAIETIDIDIGEVKENSCPNCSQTVPDNAMFCPKCGQKLASLCPNCKKPIQSSAVFCGFCGSKLPVPQS